MAVPPVITMPSSVEILADMEVLVEIPADVINLATCTSGLNYI